MLTVVPEYKGVWVTLQLLSLSPSKLTHSKPGRLRPEIKLWHCLSDMDIVAQVCSVPSETLVHDR